MSGFFRSLLGFILLASTIGLATCQAMVKADSVDTLTERRQPWAPGYQ